MTMKKILAMTLVVLMIISMVPANALFFTSTEVANAVVDGVATKFDDLQEALDAADEGSVVTMTKDVVVDAPLVVTNNVILDMAGHKISNTEDIWDVAEGDWSLISVRGGVLVIDGDGSLLAKENDCYAIDICDGGACTIKSGTFVGNISAVYVYEGSAFIKGGKFSIQQKESGDTLEEQCRMTINCLDANYKSGDAAVLITGGSFANWDPTNNAAEGAGTSFTNEYYEAVKDEDGNFVVSCTCEHEVTSSVTVMASCIKEGSITVTCDDCGEVVSTEVLPKNDEHVFYNGKCLLCQAEEVIPCEHDYQVVKEEKATCLFPAYVWYECSLCGAEKSGEEGVADPDAHEFVNGVCLCGAEEPKACEHDFVIVRELKATCIEGGYVWTECSMCGLEKNYETDPATGEHGETYLNIIESTCAKAGVKQTVCKICDTVLDEEKLPLSTEHVIYNGGCLVCGAEMPACEHTATYTFTVMPNCSQDGSITVICKDCEETISVEVLPMNDEHTFHEGRCLLCGAEEPTPECKHEYEIVKELKPTCEEAGYVWTKCSLCGNEKNYESDDALGHDFSVEVAGKAATCEEEGYSGHAICSRCDATQGKLVIAPKGHDFSVEVAPKAPTCEEEGYGAHVQCSRCDETKGKFVIAPKGHDMVKIPAKEATCEEEGYGDHVECSVCKKTEGKFVIAPKGHDFVEEVAGKAPTCTEEGYSGHAVCSRCDATQGRLTIAPLGHDFSIEVAPKAPTCEEEGYGAHVKCSRCDATQGKLVVAPKGHDLVKVPEKEATCEEEGYSVHAECTVCGKTVGKLVIAPKGHEFSIEVAPKAPTCTEEGYGAHVKCGRCDATKGKLVVAPKGHDFSVEVAPKAPTCTEPGYGSHAKCSRCDETKGKLFVAPTGHNYVLDKVAPTCTEDGKEFSICTECKDVLPFSAVIPAIGHEFVDGICERCEFECDHANGVEKFTAPTCTDYGSHSFYCEDCNFEKFEWLDPMKHSYIYDLQVEATCDKDGLIWGKCEVCGDFQEIVVPAMGHKWVDGVCDRCEAKCEEHKWEDGVCAICATKCEHDMRGELSSCKEPTCVEDGFKGHKCAICGFEEFYDVPAMGHEWADGVCARCEVECEHIWAGEQSDCKEPTCVEDGFKGHKCETCGVEKFYDVPALGHDFVDGVCTRCGETDGCKHEWIGATCTVAKTCMICGEVEGEAMGHLWGEWFWLQVPTCVADGIQSRVCEDCGESEAVEILTNGHAYEDVITDATCTADGSIVSTCVNCGDVKTEVLAALGHSFVDGVCGTCGEKEVVDPQPTDPTEPTDPKPTDPKPTDPKPTVPGGDVEEPANNKTVIIVLIVLGAAALGVAGFFLVKKFFL